MKIAVCTTFPSGYPTAQEMLATFDAYWPKEVDIFIDLDPMPEAEFQQALDQFAEVLPNRTPMMNCTWSDEKKQFYAQYHDKGNDYRFHVCRFGHKVFTLHNLAKQIKDTHDYLIWLDADIITHKEITLEKLKEWLPEGAASYLGRTAAPHSECGFVAYNMKHSGPELIAAMHDYYVSGKVFELPGWTDCDVFDHLVQYYRSTNLAEHVKVDKSINSDGWHVWPFTDLGNYTEHKKGARKFKRKPKSNVVMGSDLQVKTKNCLPNEVICANITENLKQIKHWVSYCKPHDEPLVICSAGETLAYTDIKPWADKGVKIVTVKHAIDRLKQWGIKPWACVLLDPRQHVEGFVEKPDTDVVYFVASMVAPAVVKKLLDCGCRVIGYHAFVGAGEKEILAKHDPKTLLVSGGSATATRSIGLFAECLGFKEFHLYGYDLCYFDRPDFSVKDDSGNPKYMEVTLGAEGWGNSVSKRVFWTEGQLLAQAQELRDLYKMQKDFTLNVYGAGMAAWWFNHQQQQLAWIDRANAEATNRKLNGNDLNEWIAGL